MSPHDPYNPPADITDQASLSPPPVYAAQPSPKTVEYLSATRPWVLFLSVLGFIGAAFAVLVVLGSLAIGLMGEAAFGPEADNISLITALVYVPIVGVYVLFSVLLVRYASAIGRLLNSGRTGDVEDALLKQKMFWKAAGITAIVGVGCIILAAIIGVVVAIATGLPDSGRF
jgi:hypothetical protein